MTDYKFLVQLREQALLTRVMVLEDAIRQFLRGKEGVVSLASALDDREGQWDE